MHREKTQSGADKKTARIPHKDRRGIKIMDQKAAERSGERQCHHRVLQIALLVK